MPDPIPPDLDISFDLSKEQSARLKEITDLAGNRKQLLVCSVRKEKDGALRLVFHAAFHDAKYIAQNGPFGPPRPK